MQFFYADYTLISADYSHKNGYSLIRHSTLVITHILVYSCQKVKKKTGDCSPACDPVSCFYGIRISGFDCFLHCFVVFSIHQQAVDLRCHLFCFLC